MKMKEFLGKFSFSSGNCEENKHYRYRCVNCGHRMKELTVTYSPSTQKLAECDNCKEIADKLIEFEVIVIIIDLILLSTQAQRHILFNTNCKNLYKTLMVITLLESYCLWMENFERKFDDGIESTKDPLFMEKGFYLSTLQIILCKIKSISTHSDIKLTNF
jgi:hypothetical protein